MANQRKSGLGRGLSSLLGESYGETGQRPVNAQEIIDTPVSEEESAASSTVEETRHTAPAIERETVFKAPVVATVSAAAAEAAEIVERPANTAAAPAPVKEPTRAEAATRKATMQGDVAKPKPYIEEDDGATIKSVRVREVRRVDAPSGIDDEIDITLVEPNPDQPRTNFKPEEIDELANSIQRDGLLQPVLVRKVGEKYQIIAGERRWQACRKLGLKKISIRVKDVEDDKALELALIENIQRSDLNPIEEAYGYKRLMERQGMTQSEVAQAVSKGRSTIANALRLLDLPESAQELLYNETITAGHARAILSIPAPAGREKLTEKLKEEKLSVRETEALARLYAGQAQNIGDKKSKREPTPTSFKKAARTLRERLRTNVRIKTVKGKNKIEIEFANEDELKRIFEQILTGAAKKPQE